MKKKMAWGKYKGSKRVAILWGSTLIPEHYKVIDLYGVSSTSAAQRLLKAETGQNYDIIKMDYTGEFYADEVEIGKVERLLRSLYV